MSQKQAEIYTLGPLSMDTRQGAVDVINAYYQWMNGGSFTNLEEMQINWSEDGFDPQTDAQVILSPDGNVVGYADLWSITALNVRYFSIFAFDPVHQDAVHHDARQLDSPIPQTLLDWLIKRAHEKVDLALPGARVVLHIGANQANQPLYEFLSRNGFQVVRCSYRMRIDFDGPPAKPSLPKGISIRSIANKVDERAAHLAAFESFRDHWGFVEEPFEAYYNRWIYQLTGDPNYDPSLFFIALDGDEVAGVSLCYPRTEEDAGMAWVGTLGVRRAWRNRGLGSALLQHSFNTFYARGIRRAGLGVDAENLTGALRLYEKAGMRPWRKNATYELELRPGKDLMKKE